MIEATATPTPFTFATLDALSALGGNARRFQWNLQALQLLRDLEDAGRAPTPAEQLVLAQYTAFGNSELLKKAVGIVRHTGRYAPTDDLAGLISDEEAAAIARGALTQFFTPLPVATALGQVAERALAGVAQPRILEPAAGIGMIVGLNVQERCYAVHHLTTPWRPCDVKQADGRIWRPGNLFPEVWIFHYVAAPSFDGFSWQGIETKGRFEDAYLRGDPSVRIMQDIDEQIISAGEIKALASGDPRIVQKVRLEHELDKLEQQRRGWEGTRRGERFKALQTEGEAADLERRADVLQSYLARRGTRPTLALFDTAYDLADPAQHAAHGKAIRDALIAWGTTPSAPARAAP